MSGRSLRPPPAGALIPRVPPCSTSVPASIQRPRRVTGIGTSQRVGLDSESRTRSRHDEPMTSAPVLVILRGNSASGKSTIARKVQHHLPQGRIAVIGQDSVRPDVLWEEGAKPVATIALTELMVHHCLSQGRTVILE